MRMLDPAWHGEYRPLGAFTAVGSSFVGLEREKYIFSRVLYRPRNRGWIDDLCAIHLCDFCFSTNNFHKAMTAVSLGHAPIQTLPKPRLSETETEECRIHIKKEVGVREEQGSVVEFSPD